MDFPLTIELSCMIASCNPQLRMIRVLYTFTVGVFHGFFIFLSWFKEETSSFDFGQTNISSPNQSKKHSSTVLSEARNACSRASAARFECSSANGGNSDLQGVSQLSVFSQATEQLFSVDGSSHIQTSTSRSTMVGEAHVGQLSRQRHARVPCSFLQTTSEVPGDASECVSHNSKKDADSDSFDRYSQLCARNVKPSCSTVSYNSKTDADSDAFDRYSQLCEWNVKPRCSPYLLQPADSGSFGTQKHLYSYVFEKYSQLCAGNVTPPFTTAEVQESAFLKSADVNALQNTQPIHNEVTILAFPTTPDSRHAGTSVSTQRKKTRENFQAVLVASENAPLKRTRGSTEAVGNRWPRRVTCGRSSPVYDDLGDCDQQCHYCGATFWYGERLKGHRRAEYHLCCGGGKMYMQLELEPPKYIKRLFQNKHFMENVRAYNQMFAMTSFRSKIDESINTGKGPYIFKVSEQVYHWIGSMCPPVGEAPRFLQLYIYDTDNEVENRMRHFGGLNNSSLDPEIVEGLIHFLDAHNEMVQLFRTCRDKCREIDIPEFKIRLYNAKGARCYELPTLNTLGEIVFDSGHASITNFDVIIQHKDGPAQRIRGPRYMYAHYLDALAICRKLGNPHFFITFTCNVNWPEIIRYMAQFPELITSDRTDVVYRVFEQKMKLFVAFLKKERTFGDVTGVLYTVEFQKHGLPHCHTLLWVDSASEIQSPEDVDHFISADLQDPNVDPHGYRIVSEMMIHGPCGAANLSAPSGHQDEIVDHPLGDWHMFIPPLENSSIFESYCAIKWVAEIFLKCKLSTTCSIPRVELRVKRWVF
ncbi:DNA helicase [Tanacetum coccineum]